MANVHRIGDYENNNNGNSNYNRLGGDNNDEASRMMIQGMNIPFINLEQSRVPPRKETFFDMLKMNFCPRLKWLSFTVFITILNTTLFIVTSSQGIIHQNDSLLLQQNPQVLIDFGANFPYNIKHYGQVWRLVTAAFLHLSFLHILMNTISTLILVSQAERSFGVLITAAMWIIAAIGGNIFSANFASANSLSVGASTSIMGIVGLFLGYLILNWKGLAVIPQLRCMLLCITIFMVILVFIPGSMSTPSSNTQYQAKTDNYGHLGGLLTGIMAGVVILKPIRDANEKYEKNAKYLFSFFLGLFFILTFTLFYTATDF